MRSSIVAGFGLAVCLSSAAASQTYTVKFDPGTYSLASHCANAPATPCGSPSDGTLTITINPATMSMPTTATFVVSTDETDTVNLIESASFTLPQIATATGLEPDNPGLYSPYFSGAELTGASWDTSVYTTVVFWAEEDGGGLEIADSPALNTPLLEQFNPGPTDLPFTVIGTPEPATWSLLMLGIGAAGLDLRRRRVATL